MDHTNFISELERCILANSSSPPEKTPNTYSSDELANMYLNGEFNEIDEDELSENGYSEVDEDEIDSDDEDLIQVIYIDDSNFDRLEPEQIKEFITQLSIILGASPYSEDEVNRFIQQCKKPKN